MLICCENATAGRVRTLLQFDTTQVKTYFSNKIVGNGVHPAALHKARLADLLQMCNS